MFLEILAPENLLNLEHGYDSDAPWPTIKIPALYVVCSTCHGKGRHSNAIGVITQEDRDQNWDDESFEAYMRGEYDQTCEECKGLRVVMSIDETRATEEQIKLYNDYQREQDEYEQESRMEYRMTSEYSHEVRGW